MDNIEERFDSILEKFLKEEKFVNGLSEEEAELFEVALLLKEKRENPNLSKEKIFEKSLNLFRETVASSSQNQSLFSFMFDIFGLLFDVSPVNNNEHLTLREVYKSSDKIFYKIKFYSYLQSRQFLYNYIWSLQAPLGLETLH
ncbi:hypothetical protein [Caldisericum exile]|uniref:Uncharacterized protein n=1 Tax=Caldisericum exile (strain DSM 21853 / NBRC 104410 / AZM16c01) TaxID=511051 RepID=A0A7U6GF85_CALEA|nr:hypothetical protein [Caldisericum exile]BAL81298.1 hypothetical protein CSE_11720 [Caldisericum exile AZM16c01]